MKKNIIALLALTSTPSFAQEIIMPLEMDMNSRTSEATITPKKLKVLEVSKFSTHCSSENGKSSCSGWLGNTGLVGFGCRENGPSEIAFEDFLYVTVSSKEKCELINKYLLRTLEIDCYDILSNSNYCYTDTNFERPATHKAVFTIDEKAKKLLKVEFVKL